MKKITIFALTSVLLFSVAGGTAHAQAHTQKPYSTFPKVKLEQSSPSQGGKDNWVEIDGTGPKDESSGLGTDNWVTPNGTGPR